MSDTNVVLCGDSHGEWDALFRKLEHLQIEDCVLLHVGDLGVGFKSLDKQHREIELLNNRFKKRNIQFKGARGNHDDPKYFLGTVNHSHFELIRDYSYQTFNGDCSLYMERKRNTLINTIRMSQGKGRYTKEVLYERYPII